MELWRPCRGQRLTAGHTANQEFVQGQTSSQPQPTFYRCFYYQLLVYSLSVSLYQFKNVIKYLISAGAFSKLFTFITRRLYSSQKSCETDGIVIAISQVRKQAER